MCKSSKVMDAFGRNSSFPIYMNVISGINALLPKPAGVVNVILVPCDKNSVLASRGLSGMCLFYARYSYSSVSSAFWVSSTEK
jgi:hypothetical protein